MFFYLLVVNKNYLDLFIIFNINIDNVLIFCGNNILKVYYVRFCVLIYLKIFKILVIVFRYYFSFWLLYFVNIE